MDGDGEAIAQLDLVALNRKGLALQRRRGLKNTEKGDRNALAALVRPSSSLHVSGCGWIPVRARSCKPSLDGKVTAPRQSRRREGRRVRSSK